MGFTAKRLRKDFPHLAAELEKGAKKIPIDSVRAADDSVGKGDSDNSRDYVPDVVDFIRRCDTEKEAKGIIDFMEARRELSPSYAEKLRRQLIEKGVRSFGPRKQHNYYFNYFKKVERESQEKG